MLWDKHTIIINSNVFWLYTYQAFMTMRARSLSHYIVAMHSQLPVPFFFVPAVHFAEGFTHKIKQKHLRLSWRRRRKKPLAHPFWSLHFFFVLMSRAYHFKTKINIFVAYALLHIIHTFEYWYEITFLISMKIYLIPLWNWNLHSTWMGDREERKGF